MKTSDLSRTCAQLEESRRRITALESLSDSTEHLFRRMRHDYFVTERSKFARLRALWEDLKSIFAASQDVLPPTDSRNVEATLSELWPAAIDTAEQYASVAEAFRKRLPSMKLAGRPLVTVIIPAYNNVAVTMRCLQSIADEWYSSVSAQFIVVDDCSTDATESVVGAVPGVTVLRNAENQGFLLSCNRAMAEAHGEYTFLLNNDTVVTAGWLDELVATAEKDTQIGVVGSKLLYPNGRLQEAGNILWRDGSGWQYGHLDHPDDPLYNFVREVDYCSAASLLIRSNVLERLGNGFDPRYAPAYYEDSDLCMAVRALGYKVVYQPRSVVIHYEGLTSGTSTSSGAKRFQDINAPKFAEKWRHVLTNHFDNNPNDVYRAARRLSRFPRILIINDSLPLYDKDAGSQRLMRIIEILVAEEFSVQFHSVNYAPIQPYTAELQALGVEVLHYHDGPLTAEHRLKQAFSHVDVAWVCRPDVAQDFVPWLRQYSHIKRVYDTVDLHFVRARRQAQLEGRFDDRAWKQMRDLELRWARECDATITVTPQEKRTLEKLGISDVHVIPTIHDLSSHRRCKFAESRDLLFIGGYGHPPNIDAAEWIVQEIMPLIWIDLPDVRLTLLGSEPPPTVLALRSNRVIVPGYIPDVAPYFLEHRIFVAPLRYGAGLKGKIGEAMSYRLPVVTTPVGAEGFELRDGADALIATDAKHFAASVVRLYTDGELWLRLSENCAKVVERFSTEAVTREVVSLINDVVETVH
ncbi:MAG: glycosyltransferase [Acidobacteriaceae bacterium]|nr:glycosyltransferase [Acidobacteriaceae bacterium]